MTPAAATFLRELASEAAHWDDVTTTDAPAIERNRAEAMRNALNDVIQRLTRVFADVEAEAVEEYRGVAEWLENGAGIAEAA